jgi:hypothetical protein
MISNSNNQKALAEYVEHASLILREYKQATNVHQLQEESVFALGAQLMHIGQCLTSISGFKLEPPTLESRIVLTEIVRYLEMPTISIKEG